MTMETVFKTKFQQEREQRELAIYTEYQSLAAAPDNSKVAIAEYLCEKYHLATISTIYSIRKRVENRLKRAGKL